MQKGCGLSQTMTRNRNRWAGIRITRRTYDLLRMAKQHMIEKYGEAYQETIGEVISFDTVIDRMLFANPYMFGLSTSGVAEGSRWEMFRTAENVRKAEQEMDRK